MGAIYLPDAQAGKNCKYQRGEAKLSLPTIILSHSDIYILSFTKARRNGRRIKQSNQPTL